MIECAADGSACHLPECAGGCCELRARELKQTLSTYPLESNETPASIIEELAPTDWACSGEIGMLCNSPSVCLTRGCQKLPQEAKPGLRLLDGDSAAPTHADTAPVRTAKLLRWHGITRLDLPPERILDAAQADDLRCVVVLGYKADGSEYFASSLADGADVLWLLERLKLQLLTTGAETDPT